MATEDHNLSLEVGTTATPTILQNTAPLVTTGLGQDKQARDDSRFEEIKSPFAKNTQEMAWRCLGNLVPSSYHPIIDCNIRTCTPIIFSAIYLNVKQLLSFPGTENGRCFCFRSVRDPQQEDIHRSAHRKSEAYECGRYIVRRSGLRTGREPIP